MIPAHNHDQFSTLTDNFSRHEKQIEPSCDHKPLHHFFVFELLPLLGAASARLRVRARAAAQAGRLDEGIIIIGHHQRAHGHPVGRRPGGIPRRLPGHNHLQLVESGQLVLHQVAGEVDGSRVIEVQVG